jgi:hypothetical protein
MRLRLCPTLRSRGTAQKRAAPYLDVMPLGEPDGSSFPDYLHARGNALCFRRNGVQITR